jgi:hypothetical protein
MVLTVKMAMNPADLRFWTRNGTVVIFLTVRA